MNIIFDRNINLFENKNELQIIKSLPHYKKFYKPIFLKFINEFDFDIGNIDSIHIVHDKQSYGTTKHFIKDGKISFNIELSDDIIIYISDIQNSLDAFKAKSVFQHEICHCIEIRRLYENHYLEEPNPLDENFVINTTYSFLYEQAVKIWSEFFACYHNRKINEWHECPNVELDIIELNKWISATQYCLNNNKSIRLCEDMLSFLYDFWYHMVSVIAIYFHNKEDILINDYKNTKYNYVPEYFEFIYQCLKANLDFYPVWLSEENYIKFGKALMKILELNSITYSTDDLSDNFIFIKSR